MQINPCSTWKITARKTSYGLHFQSSFSIFKQRSKAIRACTRDEIQDQFGNAIYLTDERWEHIIEEHPELDGHRVEVLSTVRSGKRSQDPLLPNKFFYNIKLRQVIDEFDEIEVVVVFRWQHDKPNNFIVTAYPV